MEEQASVPGTHSANEPNEPTAGSDSIEKKQPKKTTATRHHPTLHFVIAH